MRQLLSILTPMYNEAAGLGEYFQALEAALAPLDIDYEIVCVDDGSRDDTLSLLKQHAERNPRIKIVALSRNFGKEAAMTAALDYASGDVALPMDADLQDPPELIAAMLAKWREGYQVVYAKRSSRKTDGLIKRKTARLFYKVFNRLSDIKIPEDVGDFRLLDRGVIEAIKQLPEKDRFMKGLFCWPGLKHTVIEFERQKRAQGTSKYNYWNLWNFALSGITSFSTFPIRAGIYLGLTVATFSFLFGLWVIFKTVITGVDVPGYASLLVAVLFMGGIQLFFLGLLGEYIGRIYKEVKNRPIYLVEDEIGFHADKAKTP
ncbi:glycosyltransferase family 2 protein [Marinimicrobium sp. ABcell2]|uniref:glycosyltransferase family 2 protein n=1 Tax=Marinimicrobium sp. ABcell2 TaxID=3069751 RepID=UPI0027B34B46|nr:glycosyltransferase family 2 protein [Marinimicrobium sp. ABcell2]MDQ2075931.1 glycosyltransferase family 2 protein [Marinimicrobium sp. ABcell2]